MKKPKKPVKKVKNKKMPGLWNLGGLVLLGLFIVIFHSWVRATVLPKLATPFYTHGVQTVMDEQSSNLRNPFVLLGFTNVSKSGTHCALEDAEGIHTEIDCSPNEQSYTKLPAIAPGVASEQKQAMHVQDLLAVNGWSSGSNGVTLTSLVDGTAHGVDYSADAFYQKIVGRNDCVFDVMIAYANPQPPAIRATLTCDRTVNILGVPSHEFYNSSKGNF